MVDFTSNSGGLTDGVILNGTISTGGTQTYAVTNAINAAFPGRDDEQIGMKSR